MKYVILGMHRECRLGTKGFILVRRIFPKSSTATNHSSPTQRNSQMPLEHEFFIRYPYPYRRPMGPQQATEPDRCKNNQNTGTAPANFARTHHHQTPPHDPSLNASLNGSARA